MSDGEEERPHRELVVKNNEELESNKEEEKPHGELVVANNEDEEEERIVNNEELKSNMEEKRLHPELVVENNEDEEEEIPHRELVVKNNEELESNKEDEKPLGELVVANNEDEEEERIVNNEKLKSNKEEERLHRELVVKNNEDEEEERPRWELVVKNNEELESNKEDEKPHVELVVANNEDKEEERIVNKEELESNKEEEKLNRKLVVENNEDEEEERPHQELVVKNNEELESNREDEKAHGELVVANNEDKEEERIVNDEELESNKEEERLHRELVVENNEDEEEERPHRELVVANNEELVTHLTNLLPSFFHEGTKYSLTVNFPISNEDLSKLAISPLGQFLEELVIRVLINVRYTSYPSLFPENLTSESKFPKLKKLEMEGQPISAVHFVSEVFPVLEDLSVSHAGSVSFHLNLPTIRFLEFKYFMVGGVGGNGYDDFEASLSRSPKLESLTSYKFILLADEYFLILPNCSLLSFYRSDCLSRLSLFAPKLKTLNLQACYDIDQVNLLTEVPDWMRRGDKDDSYQFSPPDVTGPEYSVSGPLSVVEMNCYNTRIPKGTWRTSRRCWVVQEDWSDELGDF